MRLWWIGRDPFTFEIENHENGWFYDNTISDKIVDNSITYEVLFRNKSFFCRIWKRTNRYSQKVSCLEFSPWVTHISNFNYWNQTLLEISWTQEIILRQTDSRTDFLMLTKPFVCSFPHTSNLYTKFQIAGPNPSEDIVITRMYFETEVPTNGLTNANQKFLVSSSAYK